MRIESVWSRVMVEWVCAGGALTHSLLCGTDDDRFHYDQVNEHFIYGVRGVASCRGNEKKRKVESSVCSCGKPQ